LQLEDVHKYIVCIPTCNQAETGNVREIAWGYCL